MKLTEDYSVFLRTSGKNVINRMQQSKKVKLKQSKTKTSSSSYTLIVSHNIPYVIIIDV